MRTSEKENLMRDVLRDESYLAFREGLRVELVRRVRRQRAARFQRRLLAVAACLPLALGLVLFRFGRDTGRPHPEPLVAAQRVLTVPLAPADIILARPVEPIQTSRSVAANVSRVVTATDQLGIVRTTAQPLQLLNDEQLLELFKDRAVVLARDNWGQRQLLLPSVPSDR